MRKILAAAVTLAFFAVAAYAGEVEGKVQGVDRASRTITPDRTSYIAADSVEPATMQAGARVKITDDETPPQANASATDM